MSSPEDQRVRHRARWHDREKMRTIRSHTESERPATTQGKTFWNLVCSFVWKSYQFTVDKAIFIPDSLPVFLLSFRGLAREGFLSFDPGALVHWKTRLTTGDGMGSIFLRSLVCGLPSPRGRSAGSFPELRLVIEPRDGINFYFLFIDNTIHRSSWPAPLLTSYLHLFYRLCWLWVVPLSSSPSCLSRKKTFTDQAKQGLLDHYS